MRKASEKMLQFLVMERGAVGDGRRQMVYQALRSLELLTDEKCPDISIDDENGIVFEWPISTLVINASEFEVEGTTTETITGMIQFHLNSVEEQPAEEDTGIFQEDSFDDYDERDRFPPNHTPSNTD